MLPSPQISSDRYFFLANIAETLARSPKGHMSVVKKVPPPDSTNHSELDQDWPRCLCLLKTNFFFGFFHQQIFILEWKKIFKIKKEKRSIMWYSKVHKKFLTFVIFIQKSFKLLKNYGSVCFQFPKNGNSSKNLWKKSNAKFKF